ncbi:MAG: helix-turn-helix domain-containing protein [Saprospiraceae bacterium]|nr:helix-turn-helix domain-containing protein [Saprospiraceae bacterium]
MKKETLNLLFGLKVRLLRQQQGLTLQQLVEKSGVALSFLHDIEKGKKRPSADKIVALASALGTTYDYLVSVHGSKQLQPIVDLLESDFFKSYPLQVFGIEPAKLIELLANDPEKVNALIGTVLKIARNHHMSRENLYSVSLRSYQDMHDNHFPNLETAAQNLRRETGLDLELPVSTKSLEKILLERFGIRTDRTTMAAQPVLKGVRSWFDKEKNVLFLNQGFSPAQENFLIGRELGFQTLGLTERPYETIIVKAESFEKLLHNFQASYFASALVMDENQLAEDIRRCAGALEWRESEWLELLDRYNVTPEMLLQRFTNILPHHFGLKDLFFIRMAADEKLNNFEMTKELHLSGQQSPYSDADGHYCRRWISIDILRKMRTTPGGNPVVAGAQVSSYWQQENTYLCISMARRSKTAASITVGLLVNDKLRRIFRFLDDPALARKTVNVTCETCSIPDCGARAAAPVEIEKMEEREEIEGALKAL